MIILLILNNDTYLLSTKTGYEVFTIVHDDFELSNEKANEIAL